MSNPTIYADHAPRYLARGISAIPLQPSTKKPAIANWSLYGVQAPSEHDQQRWLQDYSDGNIGLALGPQSGVVAVDLDNDDPRILDLLLSIVPAPLWKRIGKKGAVFAYRYNGERTFRIKDERSNTILEVLSKGAQVVLPPSIHPDTQMPYTANCELLEVIDRLPCLPADFETRFREGLIDLGVKLIAKGATKITEWVPAGGRDSAMVSHAGLLARAIIKGERTLAEALGEIEVWVMNYIENVAGDPLDPAKARQKVMEFLRRDITERGKSLPPNWACGLSPEDDTKAREYFGEFREDWSLQQILDFATERFNLLPPGDQGERIALVQDILVRAAKNERLSPVDREQIIQYLRAVVRPMGVEALRRQLKDLMRPALSGEDHAAIAAAVLEELRQEGEVRYWQSKVHQWRGSHWIERDDEALLKLITTEFGHLPAARRRSDHEGILKTLKSTALAPLQAAAQPGVNFANGLLTPDLNLLPHNPDFGMTYVLPYRYLPDAREPLLFQEHLLRCWGDDVDYAAKIQALKEAMAATMFGRASDYQRAICLYGVPHSGKSVVSDIIRGMLPANAVSSIAPQDWDDRFLPAEMHNKLMNFCGELSNTAMIEGDRFKIIVEGTEIAAQRKREHPFRFKPTCAQWFASNYLPRSRDGSGGFSRRWLFLRFERAIPQEEKIAKYADVILAEEREAIAAWVLPAFVDLVARQDYQDPLSHLAAVDDMANSNNTVRYFLRCGGARFDPAASWDSRQAFHVYDAFCRTSSLGGLGIRRFQEAMQEQAASLGFSIEDIDRDGFVATVYHGIGPIQATLRRIA